MTSPSPSPAPAPGTDNGFVSGVVGTVLNTANNLGVLTPLIGAAQTVNTVTGDIAGAITGAQGLLNQFEADVVNTWNVILNNIAYGAMALLGVGLLVWGFWMLSGAESPDIGNIAQIATMAAL